MESDVDIKDLPYRPRFGDFYMKKYEFIPINLDFASLYQNIRVIHDVTYDRLIKTLGIPKERFENIENKK